MPNILVETNRDEVLAALTRAAEAAYGPERAAALADDLRGLASALRRVNAAQLDYREHPLGAD